MAAENKSDPLLHSSASIAVSFGAAAAPAGESATATCARLRSAFETRRTRPLAWRRQQLEGIARFIAENDAAICEALWKDFRKPRAEVVMAETEFVVRLLFSSPLVPLCPSIHSSPPTASALVKMQLNEIEHSLAHLEEWTAPEAANVSLLSLPGSGQIVRDPLGVALIISPWNFPFQYARRTLQNCFSNSSHSKPFSISIN